MRLLPYDILSFLSNKTAKCSWTPNKIPDRERNEIVIILARKEACRVLSLSADKKLSWSGSAASEKRESWSLRVTTPNTQYYNFK
jgi:hypothetical protein